MRFMLFSASLDILCSQILATYILLKPISCYFHRKVLSHYKVNTVAIHEKCVAEAVNVKKA